MRLCKIKGFQNEVLTLSNLLIMIGWLKVICQNDFHNLETDNVNK